MIIPVQLPSRSQMVKAAWIALCLLILPFFYSPQNLEWFRIVLPIIDLKPAANFCLVAFGFAILYFQIKKQYFQSVLAFSVLMFSTFYLLFLHNEVGFDNDFNDNASLMTLVYKLHYYGYGTDLFSARFHNSYPFVWYYFCLKLLGISGAQPFVTLKFSQNLGCFLVPIFTYLTWSKIWSKSHASVFAMLSLGYMDFFKVNAWIGLILFVPLLPYLYKILRAPSAYRWPVEDAFWIGSILVLQYYWILLLALFFPLIWLIARKIENKDPLPTKKAWIILAVLVVNGGLLSLPYTGPYALLLLSNPSEPLVNRCYYDPMSLWHYPMTNSGLIGFETLIGILTLILFFRKVRIAYWLFLILMVSFLVFYGLSGAMLFRIPSNFTKIEYIQTYLLVLGFSLAAVLQIHTLNKPILKLLVMALGLVIVHTSISQIEVDHVFRPPHDKIDDLKPVVGKVRDKATSLSTIGRPLLYLPFFNFIPFNLHWSNPCQLYTQRADFVRMLSKCKSPYAVAYALQNNRFEPIDLLIFETNKLEIILQKDNFPEPMTQEADTFSREVFTPPAFTANPTQQCEVFIPNPASQWQNKLNPTDQALFEKEKALLMPWVK